MPHLFENSIHEKNHPLTDCFTVIAFYSSTVFAQAGYTDRQALFVSVGFGAVNFLFAFPAVFTIDTCLLPPRLQTRDIFGLIHFCTLYSWPSYFTPFHLPADGVDTISRRLLLLDRPRRRQRPTCGHSTLRLSVCGVLLAR